MPDPVKITKVESPDAPAEPVAESGVKCPHCGSTLREHHDGINSLHCDSAACVGCCFLPAGKTAILRLGYPRCPAEH